MESKLSIHVAANFFPTVYINGEKVISLVKPSIHENFLKENFSVLMPTESLGTKDFQKSIWFEFPSLSFEVIAAQNGSCNKR